MSSILKRGQPPNPDPQPTNLNEKSKKMLKRRPKNPKTPPDAPTDSQSYNDTLLNPETGQKSDSFTVPTSQNLQTKKTNPLSTSHQEYFTKRHNSEPSTKGANGLKLNLTAKNFYKKHQKKDTKHIPTLNFNLDTESFFTSHKKPFRKSGTPQSSRQNQTFSNGGNPCDFETDRVYPRIMTEKHQRLVKDEQKSNAKNFACKKIGGNPKL